MKLKRNIIPKYIGIALLILLCLIFLIPDLSLRAYVFLISPKSALTMEYVEDQEAWDLADEPKDNMTIYRITKNIPHAEETDLDLVLWQVRRYGPFYVTGRYWEC